MKIKLRDLPLIYNIDKAHLYKDDHLIGETWVGSSLRFYLEEKFPQYLDYVIDTMAIGVEESSDIIVIEIYFK